AAVRMVDRVHRHAAHLGAPAEPADAARLAVGDVLVLEVADLPDGGAAGEAHAPQLARGELHEGVVALLRHELDGGARAAAERFGSYSMAATRADTPILSRLKSITR